MKYTGLEHRQTLRVCDFNCDLQIEIENQKWETLIKFEDLEKKYWKFGKKLKILKKKIGIWKKIWELGKILKIWKRFVNLKKNGYLEKIWKCGNNLEILK